MSSPTFCLLPWVSMAVRNNGDYRVCCHANTSLGRGLLKNSQGEKLNAAETGLDEARNSATMKDIRKTMLAGEWPSACGRCQREEASGIRSKRIYSKDTLSADLTEDWARSVVSEDGTLDLDKAALMDLDVRFGNKCNLACRMCGPSDSSLWVSDFEKMGGFFNAQGFDWYEHDVFWKSLEKSSKELQHIYIVGGEPLLIDRHYVYLQELIDQGRASQITLEYNSNLSILPEKALELWKHFAKVRIGVSFDGALEVNDYIRYPSKFSVIERNLEKLDKAPGNFQVWLACTVSVYNVHHLVALMRWVRSKNFQRICKTKNKEFFVPHPVHQPRHLNIQALSDEMKAKTRAHLEGDLEVFLSEPGLTAEEQARAQQIVGQYLKFMDAQSLHEHWPEFLRYTKQLDELRKQDFAQLNSLITLS